MVGPGHGCQPEKETEHDIPPEDKCPDLEIANLGVGRTLQRQLKVSKV